MKLTLFCSVFLVAMCIVKCSNGQDRDAVVSDGSWGDGIIWASGAPPGAGKDVLIGNNGYVAGSAASANVVLDTDRGIQSLGLGINSGASGVLDLNGHNLTVDSTVFLGTYQYETSTGSGTIVHNGGTITANALEVRGNSTFAMQVGDSFNSVVVVGSDANVTFANGVAPIQSMTVYNGAHIQTVGNGMVTGAIDIYGDDAQVSLGGDLDLTGDIRIQFGNSTGGSLITNGHNVAMNSLDLSSGKASIDSGRGNFTIRDTLRVDGQNSFDVRVVRTGYFDGLLEGTSLGQFGNSELFISYTRGDGNDIAFYSTFSAVPEPTSLALVGLAFIGTTLCRRRRV